MCFSYQHCVPYQRRYLCTQLRVNIQVYSYITQCQLVNSYQHFEES